MKIIVTTGKKTRTTKLEDGHVYFTPTVLVFLAIGVGWMLFEIMVHHDANRAFSIQNMIFLAMTSSSIVLFLLLLVKGHAHLVNEGAFGGWGRVSMMTAGCTAAFVVINVICGYLMEERGTYFIGTIEIYLFYAVSAPIAEESLYRVFICTVIVILVMGVFNLAGGKKNNQLKSLIANITAIAASGITFSLAHLGVYGDEPLMLLSTLLGGTVMATFYVYTKNPFVPLMAHLFNNVIAAGVIVTNAVMMIS